MPIHTVKMPDGSKGYQWGKSGKKYKSLAKAVRQMRAIFANGYKGHKKKASYLYGNILYKTAALVIQHSIKKGETPISIAKAYGVPLGSVLLRGRDPRKLQPGQLLLILKPGRKQEKKNLKWYLDNKTPFYNGRPFNSFKQYRKYPAVCTPKQLAQIKAYNDAVLRLNMDQLHWQGVAFKESSLRHNLLHKNGAGGLFGATQLMLDLLNRKLGTQYTTVSLFAKLTPQLQLNAAISYQNLINKQRGFVNPTGLQQYLLYTFGPSTKQPITHRRITGYTAAKNRYRQHMPVKPVYIKR